MNRLIGTYQEMGFAHWAPYLINGDPSGLDDEDQIACDEWASEHKHSPIGCGEEEEFTTQVPGLPGTGMLYTFPVYEGDYPDGPQFWDPLGADPAVDDEEDQYA
jgi:hypothetical protein